VHAPATSYLYTLSLHDALPISVDIHSPSSSAGPFDEDEIPSTANVYEIPYRALVPHSLDGVIVAGRCISATHEALAAIRVMPPRSEEHTSELQSRENLVCRLLL